MKPDIVLLPSFSQVEDWRKRHALKSTGGLFAQAITTFNAWIADLWELHGDGRAVVDSLQRQTIMQAAFERGVIESGVGEAAGNAGEAAGNAFGAVGSDGTPGNACEAAGSADAERDDALTVLPGVVKLAAQCVREAAGVPAFEAAVAQVHAGQVPEGVSAREAVLLQGIERYYELLELAGLVEVGHAAMWLAGRSSQVFPQLLSVLVADAAPMGWLVASFFAACDELEVASEGAPGADGVAPVADGVQLRFGFPSGRYAQPALVADLVREAVASAGKGDCPSEVVVTCKDPLSLYKQLEQPLARMGAIGCVQAQVPFAQTDFGRQYMQLARVVQDDVWAKDDLSDAAAPPFSGFSHAEALDVDRALRADRLAERDASLARLRAASDTFSQLEEVALDPDADILLGVFEQIAFSSPGRSDAWRAEQLSAVSAVRSCTKAARAVGASMASCARVLEDVVVTASYEGLAFPSDRAEGDAPWLPEQASGDGAAGARDVDHPRSASQGAPSCRVVVTTQSVAAQMGPASCDALILCDLTSDDYPVADKDDAASTLFAKLGLEPVDTALARARRTFAALQALPASQLVCVRPLNDWDGNPTYPAAVLQELVDAYRSDATTDDDLDEVFGLPLQLMDGMVQRGEEDLYANARAAGAGVAQPFDCSVDDSLGDVPAGRLSAVALPRRLPGGGVLDDFAPSPSQVESYLECPYKWFAERRLRIEGLDEGFGGLERGSFAHEVLQRFYTELVESGTPKVTLENLGECKRLMADVAGRVAAEQPGREPGSGRYVAADQIEQRELEAFVQQLVSFLDFEAAFLPTFHPAYFEFPIRLEDEVAYAGHRFIGTVDRIDVDDAGNAVIVDYKGSVGPAYEIAGKGPLDPGKVQTRMYARAVERVLGLRVVGALYVSYGKAHGCAGAFDGRVLEAAHLPGMRVDRCRCAVESPEGIQVANDVEALGALDVEDFSQLAFSDMLDATEDLVSRIIDDMQAGRVQPHPATSDSCAYCPVAHCPQRS